MRTTIDMDSDILQVAKHLAEEHRQSLGRVLSDLARRGLQTQCSVQTSPAIGRIPVLPRKTNAKPVTSQVIKELLESEF